MLIRIELTEKNRDIIWKPVTGIGGSGGFEGGGDVSGGVGTGSGSGSGTGSGSAGESPDKENWKGFAVGSPDVSSEIEIPSEYSSSYWTSPVKRISVTIPSSDTAAVCSWFDDTGSSATGSETLVKRMTSAVIGAIREFYSDTERLGLYTRGFRIQLGVLLKDGSVVGYSSPLTVFGTLRAPEMLIRSHNFQGDELVTETELAVLPRRFSATFPELRLTEEQRKDAVCIVAVATGQSTPLSGDESVWAVRHKRNSDGTVTRTWHYTRLEADEALVLTERQTDWKIVGTASLAASRISLGTSKVDVSALLGTDPPGIELPDPDNPGDPDDPDFPGPDLPTEPLPVLDRFTLRTHALDFGLPEKRKRIRRLSVRGIFEREDKEKMPVVRLYGSHHREDWRLLTRAVGAHIRLPRALGYRWYRVEIDARLGDTFDALTVTIAEPVSSSLEKS